MGGKLHEDRWRNVWLLSAQRSALSARRRRSSWDARPHDELE
jgi:hypothetical protein